MREMRDSGVEKDRKVGGGWAGEKGERRWERRRGAYLIKRNDLWIGPSLLVNCIG